MAKQVYPYSVSIPIDAKSKITYRWKFGPGDDDWLIKPRAIKPAVIWCRASQLRQGHDYMYMADTKNHAIVFYFKDEILANAFTLIFQKLTVI